jgi:Na+/H+ antiporter NhaD/arsenite permease-like protein
MTKLQDFLKEESVLAILLALFIILTALIPGYITQYLAFIDWKTIITLLSLIIAATGIKESGYLEKIAKQLLAKIYDERTLAFFMTGLSALLSTFLTNDITLFIVVPLTVGMQKILKNDLAKIVIFEAIAVNTGSTLTPIGNPQNIFLWNSWGISFAAYMLKMALPVAIMAAALAVFIMIFFRPHKLHFNAGTASAGTQKFLGIMSFCLMAVFLAALQFKIYAYMLPVILAFYLIYGRKIFAKVDWLLILTFMLMFIDFALIAKSGFVLSLLNRIDLAKAVNVYASSALISQFTSNVPGAIFMSKFSNNWEAIAYGVNIAGNGTIIGSLANIIAIRLLKPKSPGIWLEFHKYSIPFFLITGGAVWVILKITNY